VHRLLDVHFPFGEVLSREEAPQLTRRTYDLLCYIAFVKTVVRCMNRRLAILARCQRCMFGLHQFAQAGSKIRLAENLPCLGWRHACMHEQDALRVRPLC